MTAERIPGTAIRLDATVPRASRWSPLNVQAEPGWRPDAQDDDAWAEQAATWRYDSRAADAAFRTLMASRSYGPQLAALFRMDQQLGDDFAELILMLVQEAASLGAVYARQLDEAVMAGVGWYQPDKHEPMPLGNVAIALGALCGLEIVEDRP